MIGELIPIIVSNKANKKIKEKNNSHAVQIPENIDNYDIEFVRNDYQSATETKNRLEDKAKTIIAALTISVTLILNLSKIIEEIPKKIAFPFIKEMVFILAVLSIVYMLMAGVMCIQVLIKENIFHVIPLEERKDKNQLYVYTKLNVNQNIIRNNIIYASYMSIRNSVICLVILFVMTVFPYVTNGGNEQTTVGVVENKKIVYEVGAVNWLMENNQDKFPIEIFVDKYESDRDSGVVNIYNNELKILVTMESDKDEYIIQDIKANIEEMSN